VFGCTAQLTLALTIHRTPMLLHPRSPTSVSSYASWAGDGEEEAVKSKAMHPLFYRSEPVGVGCGSVVWELSRCASQFLVVVAWRKDACSGLAAG
jgi:hypothetical protein